MAGEQGLEPGADLGLEIPAAGEAEGYAFGTGDAGAEEGAALTPEQVAELQAKAERADELETQNTTLQTQLGIYQANMPNQQQEQQGVNLLTGIEFEDDENDVVMASQFKQGLKNIENLLKTVYGEVQFKMSNQGAEAAIAKHLPAMIKADPSIRTSLAALAHNPGAQMTMAFNLIKNSPSYLKERETAGKTPEQIAAAAEAAAKLKNKNRVIPAGGAPAGGGNQNLANRFANMTDEQLDAHIEKVKQNG